MSPPPGLPQGYRQGLVTAITVFLGFSMRCFFGGVVVVVVGVVVAAFVA